MPFEFKKLEIPGAILINPKVFKDERGFFLEVYEKSAFEKFGIKEMVQVNHSKSKHNTLRGLHFQREPFSQAKIVRCIKGQILDVAVDLRKKSSYFGRYLAIELTEENKKMLYIPRGFAHGFLVLSDFAEVMYMVDNVYAPDYESGLLWNDPDVNIQWPNNNPILSQKDQKLPTLRELIKKNLV